MGECKYLDNKHTVFGEVINGLPLLNKFNCWKKNSQDRPIPEIKIIETLVCENPFREAINQLKEEKSKSKENNENGSKTQKRKEFWIQTDSTGFTLPENKPKKNEPVGITKYFLESGELKEKYNDLNYKNSLIKK